MLGAMLQAFWPLIANASPYPQQLFVEVCSLEGARFIPADHGSAPSPDAQHHLPHCAFCSIAAGQLAPPPAVSLGPTAALRVTRSAAAASLPDVRESVSPHAAPPRGPPLTRT